MAERDHRTDHGLVRSRSQHRMKRECLKRSAALTSGSDYGVVVFSVEPLRLQIFHLGSRDNCHTEEPWQTCGEQFNIVNEKACNHIIKLVEAQHKDRLPPSCTATSSKRTPVKPSFFNPSPESSKDLQPGKMSGGEKSETKKSGSGKSDAKEKGIKKGQKERGTKKRGGTKKSSTKKSGATTRGKKNRTITETVTSDTTDEEEMQQETGFAALLISAREDTKNLALQLQRERKLDRDEAARRLADNKERKFDVKDLREVAEITLAMQSPLMSLLTDRSAPSSQRAPQGTTEPATATLAKGEFEMIMSSYRALGWHQWVW